MPDDRRAACAREATARLMSLPEVARGMAAGAVVAGYVAMRGELDMSLALGAARAAGAVVALPRIGAPVPPRMRFHQVDAGQPLVAGPWGLLEPDAAAPQVPETSIGVMLVPGLAFDGEGRRVGYGKGHYDEVLGPLRAAGGRRALLVGVGYDFQIVDRCPADANDVSLDLVVTEARVLGAGRREGTS